MAYLISYAQVKDLEVELETTKQRSKENLQQAILVERERYTQMQWDMEELRRKSFEMELKLNSHQVTCLCIFTYYVFFSIRYSDDLIIVM